MRVRLRNNVVLDLYCCVRQAALSLDRALSAGAWPSLLEYYDQRRLSWISSIVHGLEATLEEAGDEVSASRERPRHSGIPSIAIARLVGRFRRSILLSGDEVRFLALTLANLLKLLKSGTYPGSDALIALRLDLSAGETLLEHNGGSMPDLARCRMIEHFNQAPHLSTISVGSVLPTTDQPHARKAQPT